MRVFIFLQPKWERQIREDLRSTETVEKIMSTKGLGAGERERNFIRIVWETNKMTWLNLIEYFLKTGPASNLSSLLFHSSKPALSEARGVSCSAVFSHVNTFILCASPSLQCPSVSQTLWDGCFFQPQDLNRRKMLGRMWLLHKNFASSYAHFLSLNRQYLLTGKHIASMLFVGECKSWFVWFEFPPHHCWVVLVGCFLFGFGWGYLEGNI